MNMKIFSVLLIYIFLIINLINLIESIVWMPILGAGALFSALAGVGVNYFQCKVYECCNERDASKKWIHYDYQHIRSLSKDLDEYVYGQPLVNKLIVNILKQHLNSDHSDKSLVISFHGSTGSGKNYVSEIIVKHLYENGINSQYVHRIIGSLLFPYKEKSDEYKKQLQDFVKSKVKNCERSFFIIDEIDKMPIGVLDVLGPYLDHRAVIDGVDYRKTIFVFLSNSGAKAINKVVYGFHKNFKDRNEIQLNDIEEYLLRSAFNEFQGGLRRSDLIERNVIDHFIPFFPLEKKHVQLCIRHYVNRISNYTVIPETFVNKVINDLSFYPENESLYSVSGCKKIHAKVLLYIDDLKKVNK